MRKEKVTQNGNTETKEREKFYDLEETGEKKEKKRRENNESKHPSALEGDGEKRKKKIRKKEKENPENTKTMNKT